MIYVVKITKNGYNPPRGMYDLELAYESTFRAVKYVVKDGKLCIDHHQMYFPMDSVSLNEDGVKYPVEAVKDSKIARKLYENKILAEPEGYLVVRKEI